MLPKRTRFVNASIQMAFGASAMFLRLALEMRNLHPLRMDLSLEIIPSHLLSWINKDRLLRSHHFSFKKKIPKMFLGMRLWTPRASPGGRF